MSKTNPLNSVGYAFDTDAELLNYFIEDRFGEEEEIDKDYYGEINFKFFEGKITQMVKTRSSKPKEK